MRSGVRLGVDVGRVRVGVARSDPHGVLALPLETVARDDGAVAAIVAHAVELDAVEIVVGLPLSLGGGDTASTADAREFAARLAMGAGSLESPRIVRLVDERLSTVSAQQALRSAGRTVKSSRSVVDQVAAVIILQHALDAERAGGRPPGVVVPREGM